jgi:hypothetical protein
VTRALFYPLIALHLASERGDIYPVILGLAVIIPILISEDILIIARL